MVRRERTEEINAVGFSVPMCSPSGGLFKMGRAPQGSQGRDDV